MPRKDGKTNPLKLLLSLVSLGLLATLGSGALRPEGGVGLASWLWLMPPLAILGWSLVGSWRRRVRRPWRLHQLLALLALTGLAVQNTGGCSSPAVVVYILLTIRAVQRTAWPLSLLAPAGAMLIEVLSSYFSNALVSEAHYLAGLALTMGLAYFACILSSKGGLRALPADRLEFDEPAEKPRGLREDLQALVELMHASLEARTVALFMADESGLSFRMAACKSYSPEIARDAQIDAQRNMLGWVIRERQGLLYQEFGKDSSELGYYRGRERVGSLLAMPIMDDKKPLGLLVADSENHGKFSEPDKLLAVGFAQQAARLTSLNLKHTALGLEHERLREWNRRLEAMASLLKVEDVVSVMRDLVPKLVDCDRLVLLEMLPEAGRARVLLADPGAAGGLAAGTQVDITGSLAEQAYKLRQWRMVDDYYRRSIDLARYTVDEDRDHGFRSVLVGPLMIDEGCRYLMAIESRRPSAFQGALDTIHIVANQFSLALRSAAMYQEKEMLALRDGLTGLWNHRHFQEKLGQLISPSRREPVSLALFDIDHFKKLNDNFGHPVGDAVLREVASRIRSKISQYDFAARYGGEEFVVVWPGSDLAQAERLARELREAIGGSLVVTQAGELSVTVSLGLASYPADAQDKGSLIQAADQALYAAKRGGRDRMVCFRNMNEAEAAGEKSK